MNCRFAGDVGELFAAYCEQPLEQAAEQLVLEQVIARDELSMYLHDRRYVQEVRQALQQLRQPLLERLNGQALQQLNQLLYFDLDWADMRRILPSLVWASADDLKPLMSRPDQQRSLKFLHRGRRWLAPTYVGAAEAGLWVLDGPSAGAYIPLLSELPQGATNVCLTSVTAETTVAVGSPAEALRLTAWSAVAAPEIRPFVYPCGNGGYHDWAGANVLYWSPDRPLEWLLRSAEASEAEAASYSPGEGELPFDGNWSLLEQQLLRDRRPLLPVTAELLLKTPAAEARADILAAGPSRSVRDRLLAHLDGADRQRCRSLFDIQREDRPVVVRQKEVRQVGDAWYAGRELISEARFVINTLTPKPDGSDARAEGCVYHAGEVWTFDQSLNAIQRNPGRWLQQLLLGRAGALATVSSSWSRHLLDVARAFHQPRAIMEGRAVGWQGRALVLPNFAIDDQGLTPARVREFGPRVSLPHPLSSRELRQLDLPDTGVLAATLLYNVVAPLYQLPQVGILATSSRHLLPSLADELGVEADQQPTEEQLQVFAQRPYLTAVRSLPHQMGENRAAIAFSTDEPTAEVLDLLGGWVRLRLQHLQDCRILRQVWLALPQVLQQSPQGQQLLPTVVQALGLENSGKEVLDRLQPRLGRAHDLPATRLLPLLAELAENDDGQPQVSYSTLERRWQQSVVQPPSFKQLCQLLEGSRALKTVKKREQRLIFKPDEWALYRSYAAVPSSGL